MQKIVREPLFHFILIGALLFGVHQWRQPGGGEETVNGPGDRTITITPALSRHLAENFSRVWQRPPTAAELRGLIDDHVAEDVYYREALALGLDEDDTLIRRRLRQKMEFLSQDLAAVTEPTDAELQAFLEAHPARFQQDATLSFKQVYLNPERRDESLAADAEQLLTTLRRDAADVDLVALGDRILLDAEMVDTSEGVVARLFGGGFARQLLAIPVGEWKGPIESGYGVHLVVVTDRTEGRMPTLDEVRDAVLRDWEQAQQERANEAFFQELLARYDVVIEAGATNPAPVTTP